MIKKIVGAGILLSSLCFGTSAFAAYIPSGDKTIEITTNGNATGLFLNQNTADTSFGVQEAVYDLIKTQTGYDINHSYIWIEVNGQKVLAIDPPEPFFN